MNLFDKIRKVCRPFRIAIGIVLIIIGFLTENIWFFFGIIPLVVGLIDFCPLCVFSKKCTPKTK